MYSESDLESAIAAGALSADAAQRLRDHVAQARALPAVDEEHFRLLSGFNDIFVAIAAAILLIAVGWIGQAIPPHLDGQGPSPFAGLLVAGVAWGLAEFFTRKRRMALPSILLLLAFVGGVFATAFTVLAFAIGDLNHASERLMAMTAAASAAIAASGAWLHWRRFKVPITVAAGAAAVVGLLLAIVMSAVNDLPNSGDLLLSVTLVSGILVFLFAMRWDSSDLSRQTRRSDVAFWLHLLAAPLIVHPVFVLLGLTKGDASTGEVVVVLLLYLVLGVTALAIDRRALLVSALVYVLYALNSLFETYGLVSLSVAYTALVIGSGLLLLSAFWHQARRAVVTRLPDPLQSRLPILERKLATA